MFNELLNEAERHGTFREIEIKYTKAIQINLF